MTDRVALAIVGSVGFTNPDWRDMATDIVEHWLERLDPALVVSGGADGIDTLGVELACKWGIEPRVHLPKNKLWAPDGYKDRNLLIARDCTHLLAIRCVDSRTYGSGWTADRAEEMGRRVRRYTLPAA